MSKKIALWILLLVIVVGVGVRSWELTARSLWFDEAFSWRLAQFPLPELLSRTAADVHPPLYYILLKGWKTVFGSSLLALRAFSVFCAALTIAAGYALAAEAWRSRAYGLLAAALLALAGFQIQFAWEARMYTLGTALACTSSWLLLKALRQRTSALPWWLAYAAAAAAFAYVHYYAFFSIAAQAVFVVGYILVQTRGRVGEIFQSRVFWHALIAAGTAVALYAPWLPFFLRQNAQVQESFWIPRLGGWSMPDTLYRMWLPTAGIPRHDGVLWWLVAMLPLLITVGAYAYLAFVSYKRPREAGDATWLMLLSATIPFVISISLSLLSSQSLYQDRFFIFAHLFVLLCVPALVYYLPWRVLKIGFAAAVMVLSAGASWLYWQELDILHRPGAHAATAQVFSNYQANEPIVVSSPFVYFAVAHYAQEEFEAVAEPKLYSPSGELVHFAGGPILTTNDFVGADIFNTPSRTLWVIDTTGFGSGLLEVPSPWRVTTQARFREVHDYQGEVIVTHYTR